MATPRSDGSKSVTSSPPISTWPALGSSSPEIVRSSVDLPHPDGPTKTTNSPSLTSRLTFLITSTAPKLL